MAEVNTNQSKINWVDKEAKETIYMTPENILQAVREVYDGVIELDPATEHNNPTRARFFFTKETNGLIPWWRPYGKVFVNPPYGKEIVPFIKKIADEAAAGTSILALLPCGARFSTKYWQNSALNQYLNGICFIRGRVKFLRKDGTVAKQNPYDSQIYAYNIPFSLFRYAFKHLGKCIKTEIQI
jgi:phage N-6-adenine-methyltransferase